MEGAAAPRQVARDVQGVACSPHLRLEASCNTRHDFILIPYFFLQGYGLIYVPLNPNIYGNRTFPWVSAI